MPSKKNKIFFNCLMLFIALMVFIPVSFAIQIDLNLVRNSYSLNDFVDLTAYIFNDSTTDLNLNVSQLLVYLDSNDVIGFNSQEVLVDANNVIRVEGLGFTVTEETPTGKYSYLISALYNDRIISNKVDFTIEGLKQFNETIILSTQEDCSIPEKVFYSDEQVFVCIENIEDAELAGTLINPEGITKELNFENGKTSLETNKTGEYKLQITLTKEGYKEKNTTTEFEVIERKKTKETGKEEIKETAKKSNLIELLSQPITLIIIGLLIVIGIIIILTKWSKQRTKN